MDFSGFRGETGRLGLRPYTLEDLGEFADLHGREEVARYLPWETRDEAASRAALQRHQDLSLDKDGDGVTLAGFDEQTGRLVGEYVIFLRSVQHRGGEIGYVVHPDFQRQGYATEGSRALLHLAFDAMGMHRVTARIDARNHGSAAVLRRIGMRHEARLVENEWFKGEWTDEDDFAILRREWSPEEPPMSWHTA